MHGCLADLNQIPLVRIVVDLLYCITDCSTKLVNVVVQQNAQHVVPMKFDLRQTHNKSKVYTKSAQVRKKLNQWSLTSTNPQQIDSMVFDIRQIHNKSKTENT